MMVEKMLLSKHAKLFAIISNKLVSRVPLDVRHLAVRSGEHIGI